MKRLLTLFAMVAALGFALGLAQAAITDINGPFAALDHGRMYTPVYALTSHQ
jgi:hypothetical protein